MVLHRNDSLRPGYGSKFCGVPTRRLISAYPLRYRTVAARKRSSSRVTADLNRCARPSWHRIFAGPMPRVERYDVAVPLAVRVAYRQCADFLVVL
jgi:hypothetical protein